jgi:hypothetical protein
MTPGTTIPIMNNIPLQTSTNPGESMDSGEDTDPKSGTPGARKDNKTDEVADPGFVATTGVSNMTRLCGDIDHIQLACTVPKGLDTGKQTSTMDDTWSHTPTSSTTPNADENAHLYSVDARKLLAPYTPCQFHSFGNLETVASAFKAFHLSINYEESLAPTIVAAAAEPMCTQLDYITLEGRSDARNNWSLCLLDFLKNHHVKFRMIIQVFGAVSFHSSIPDDEGGCHTVPETQKHVLQCPHSSAHKG